MADFLLILGHRSKRLFGVTSEQTSTIATEDVDDLE